MKTKYAAGLMLAGFLGTCISSHKCLVSHERLEHLIEIQKNQSAIIRKMESNPSFVMPVYSPGYLNRQINKEYVNEAGYGSLTLVSLGLGTCGAIAFDKNRKSKTLHANNK